MGLHGPGLGKLIVVRGSFSQEVVEDLCRNLGARLFVASPICQPRDRSTSDNTPTPIANWSYISTGRIRLSPSFQMKGIRSLSPAAVVSSHDDCTP